MNKQMNLEGLDENICSILERFFDEMLDNIELEII